MLGPEWTGSSSRSLGSARRSGSAIAVWAGPSIRERQLDAAPRGAAPEAHRRRPTDDGSRRRPLDAGPPAPRPPRRIGVRARPAGPQRRLPGRPHGRRDRPPRRRRPGRARERRRSPPAAPAAGEPARPDDPGGLRRRPGRGPGRGGPRRAAARPGEFRLSGPDGPILVMRARRSPPHGVWVVLEDVSELRRLQQIRTEFVDNLSHELRTPLSTVSLLAETLARDAELAGDAVPPKMRERVDEDRGRDRPPRPDGQRAARPRPDRGRRTR